MGSLPIVGRGATCNLAAKRATGVLFEQLGQLLAHAVRHAAFDWLRCSTKPAIKHFFDGRDAHSLAFGAGGETDQLFDQGRRLLTANLFQLTRYDVRRAFLATARFGEPLGLAILIHSTLGCMSSGGRVSQASGKPTQ